MPHSRQLAAIMFTDIVGYTALMGDDEQKAFELLRQNRQLQKPLIEKFNGTWIKELGDGVLASFTTVTDAVMCASEIQNVCNEKKDFRLRIGIHLGEVVFEDNDVFGDGVNIASRLQAIAPIGGIWISESVYNNISNKQNIKAKFIKKENLKNVKEAIHIYEIIIASSVEPINAAAKETSKKNVAKSIAVLPFINMSSDPEQEFFSDGLTEEIISDLSQLEKLLVISRSSIMTFKGTNKKIKEIANEVNVRYILEGSVRKSGNNLRITAQLIDALNDGHVWTEKYSGTMDDVFDIQEKVSRSIVEALDLKLTIKEDTILSQHPIQNAKAYECYIRARQEMWKLTEQGLDNAIVLAEQGLDLEPDSALLYATLSTAYLFFYHYGIKPDTSSVEKAHHYASKSLELDANCPQAHVVYGVIEFKKGNVQEASKIFKKALSLDKNSTDALSFLIPTYFLSGKPEDAKPYSEKLLQLDPLLPLSHALYGIIEWYSGKGKETLPYFRKWLKMDPESPFARLLCSYNFAFNNEREESIQVLETMIRDMPTLIFGKFAFFFRSALQGDRESALKYATEELKDGAASMDYFPIIMAFGYALIDEKDEAVKWLNRTLHFGHCTYPLLLNFEIFQHVLKDHPGFHAYMEEIKKRSEQFVV